MKTNTACMNKQRAGGYWRMGTVFRKGMPEVGVEYIVDTSSKLCRSDQDIAKVGACAGCLIEQEICVNGEWVKK